MPLALPELPYAQDALEPYMSEKTVQFHYGKHHKSYVDKANGLLKGTTLETEDLEDIVRKSAGHDEMAALFNNAAQVWNHSFFWNCMKPGGGGTPEGAVAEAVARDFGGLDGFKEAFAEAATGRFGSGWVWVVLKDGGLDIVSTPNAETPIASALHPILSCDVWEHAYYLDYQNERGKFVNVFLEKLVNWDFVAARLAEAQDDAKRSAA